MSNEYNPAAGAKVYTWINPGGGDVVEAVEATVLRPRCDQGFVRLEYFQQEQDLDGNDYPTLSLIQTSTNLIWDNAEDARASGQHWVDFLRNTGV